MAITWNVTISEIGQNSGNYNVSAQVIDDTKPIDRQTESVSVQGRMDNQTQKEGLFDALKQLYQSKVSVTTSNVALETEAKAYLEK